MTTRQSGLVLACGIWVLTAGFATIAWGEHLTHERFPDETLSDEKLPDDAKKGVGTGMPVATHKLNYVLPYTYDWEKSPDRQARELKFQFSFKKQLWSSGVFLGYTQTSFWQIYDKKNSRPFRETNYNPEIFYDSRPFRNDEHFRFLFGFEHESNGRENAPPDDPDNVPSRAWNRIYLWPSYEKDDWWVEFKYWGDLLESVFGEDSQRDDNPDIDRFLGRFEFTAGVRISNIHPLSVMFRQGTREDTSTYQVDYLFRLSSGLYLHVQYFDGVGESLIDYNREVRKLGVGFAFE